MTYRARVRDGGRKERAGKESVCHSVISKSVGKKDKRQKTKDKRQKTKRQNKTKMNRNQRWNCNVIRYATFQARQSKAKEAKEKKRP